MVRSRSLLAFCLALAPLTATASAVPATSTATAAASARVEHLEEVLVGDLAEDGVAVVQPRGRVDGDEELGTVRARASVSHGQQVRAVELQLRMELVGELETRAASAGAGRVAALDHEVIDDAVEDCAVIERTGLLALCVLGGVVLLALGQADEVFNGYRCVVTEEIDNNVTVVGMHRCSCGLLSHASHCKEFNACLPRMT